MWAAELTVPDRRNSETNGRRLRTFGAVGDVHAQDRTLEVLVQELQRLGVDQILCCGDVVDGAGDPDRCVRLLRECHALVVRGNHERWLIADTTRDLPGAHRLDDLTPETASWLAALPAVRRFDSPIGPIELAHGIGHDDMNRLRADTHGYGLENDEAWQELRLSGRAALIVRGHTHHRAVFATQGICVVDAGTLLPHGPPGGVVVDLERRVYAMIEIADAGAQVGDYVALPLYAR